MKIIATFEDSQPIKVERYQNELKIGERKVEYNNFVEGLCTELPIESILAILIDQKADLKEYLDNVINDDIGLFEDFFEVLCQNLHHDLFEKLPYWDILLNKLLVHQLKLDLNSKDGVNLIKRSVIDFRSAGEQIEPELFDLLKILVMRLRGTNKKHVKQNLTRYFFNELDGEDLVQVQEAVKLTLPSFGEDWLQNEYKRILSKNSKSPVVASTGIPKNCVWMQTHVSSTKYVLEIPKSQFRVRFFDEPFEDVGHPRMLFIFDVSHEGQIKSMKLVCAKEGTEIGLDMPIYSYPYSNVYGNGSVCWSGYQSLNMPLDQVANMFLSTSNNSHLNDKTLELFKMNENKTFDEKMLLPLNGKGGTLKDVLK